MTVDPAEEGVTRDAAAAPGQVSISLREIVYGGNDGIVTTFSIVSGFAGANAEGAGPLGAVAVLLFGLANLFADSTSMGLGAFLSGRAQQQVYRRIRRETAAEIRADPEDAEARVHAHLVQRGVAPEDAAGFAALYRRNPPLMADFLMQNQLDMADPTGESPALAALVTFASFIVFGVIPLLPYILMEPSRTAFHLSVAATAGALVLLGLLRWRVTGTGLTRSLGETLLVGGLCAAIGYGVGLAFRL